MDQQDLRMKAAMIVYALEKALGEYVLQNEELEEDISIGNKNEVISREKTKGNNISNDDLSIIIESSYLNEVFNFAIDVTKGTVFHAYMKSLKEYSSLMKIFDIRNAVSHPNRPFPDCYWYRAATIASDPLIEKLKLTRVRKALISAEAGNITSPPDEWLNSVKWAIPNSLPNSFDHEITGLLGRDKEFKDLNNVLSKARNNLIAVVAPGGVGKTALILQYLKDLTLSPEWSGKIEAVVFCTLKNERLTADGVEKIEAINGIEQIKESILNDLKEIYSGEELTSFDDALNKLEERRILICIDNLETLLMHSQEKFIEFNQSLPLLWRVIVTSRISIDSATTVSLEPLDKKHAVNLGRNYFRKRGVNNFNHEDLERIAEAANNNPLAIRLTIDLYIKGIDITLSIDKSQKNIALFSYTNLIESLRKESIAILEAIYATGDSTKSELIEFLDFTNEEITESINELSKTSLIIRSVSDYGNDNYKLSDSVRDLLLVNPKNIEVRTLITNNLKRRKVKVLEQKYRDQKLGLTEFDESFVESDTEEAIYALIADLNKYTQSNIKRSHDNLVDIKKRFVDLLNYYPNNFQLHFHYSRVLKEFRDSNEIRYLNRAKELKGDNPRISLAIALYYFYNKDYHTAEFEFSNLIDKRYNDPNLSNENYSFSVTKCYLQSLLHQGKYDEIMAFTEGWEENANWYLQYGIHRASSLKRSVELEVEYSKNIQSTVKTIRASMEIFNKIFNKEGYDSSVCAEAYKLIRLFESILNYKDKYPKDFLLECVSFIASRFSEMVIRLKEVDIDSHNIQVLLKKFYNLDIENNPLHVVKWYDPKPKNVYDQEHIKELVLLDYTIVDVYHIPEDDNESFPNFIFAKDKSGDQYYLNVRNFEGGWYRWVYFEKGTKLAIKFIESKKGYNQAHTAIEIIEVEKVE
ncbi:hypothetical protein V6R21_20345 [Limibacter armeniacum]|uniref:hypothetical protein n=1 Tax=Limibacter armeniacum TaxID=466084 RepID=UPI002FE683DB